MRLRHYSSPTQVVVSSGACGAAPVSPPAADEGPGSPSVAALIYSAGPMSVTDTAAQGEAGSVRSGEAARVLPLLGRKSVLLGMLTSGFVLANAAPAFAAGTIKPSVAATVPTTAMRWTPSTAYVLAQQVITPNNDVVSANVSHTSSAAYATDTAKWALSPTYAREEVFLNVLVTGVKGDGTTDDTAAINAAITANPGKVLLFPASRTYRIVTGQRGDTDHSGGIKLNQPGTVLWCYGATFVMDTSTYQHYQIVDVTAADCAIYGGKFVGDLVAHTGTLGEWGNGIMVGAGSDRFRAQDVYAKYCWGDGFTIFERPIDVSFTNCISDNNRRQGMSIIDAIRPRVTGGAYINTGKTKQANPSGGIDLEPDPGSARDVIDAVITGVLLKSNVGPGLCSTTNGRTISATITGCRSIGNSRTGIDGGFYILGANNLTTLNGCEAIGNVSDGFRIDSTASKTKLNACTAQGNTRFGVCDEGTDTQIIGGAIQDNGASGMYLYGPSVTVAGTVVKGNYRSGIVSSAQIDIGFPGATLTSVASLCGLNAIKPAFGFVVRSAATGARLLGCDASGAFTSGAFADQTAGATAVTLPKPGTARGAAITTPAAPGASYLQSEATSMKSALDAIRTALKNHGITA